LADWWIRDIVLATVEVVSCSAAAVPAAPEGCFSGARRTAAGTQA